VARGNIPYSAVTHPRPEFRIHPGTPFSTVALHSTRVCPTSISTEPSAVATNPGVSFNTRASSAKRPPLRYNASSTTRPLSLKKNLTLPTHYRNPAEQRRAATVGRLKTGLFPKWNSGAASAQEKLRVPPPRA
jgi:hypothetical protein